MMNVRRFSMLLLAAVGCTTAAVNFANGQQATLKDAFADDFKVGVAIGTEQAMGQEPAALALAAQQFNAITPENLLKWAKVHPQPDQFNFEPVDRYVEFGEKNGMFIVGHNLVWHNQTPDWVFQDDAGNPVDRETLLKHMRDHIQAVVGRYKGRIHAWDVVNEAIEDDGSFRKSKWFEIIGEDYLAKAFEYAHEADPDAELYYNDYNEWKPEKRAAVIRLVRSLQTKGLRIDGVGLQGHWGLHYPSLEEMEAMFQDYSQLDVKLMITELDISVLPFPVQQQIGADVARRVDARPELNPYQGGLPDDAQQLLSTRYAEVFRAFQKYRDRIDRVTFWGVHDGHSWRNYWPVTGRTDYPLLFDRELQPKPAFDAVIKTAE